MSLTLNWVGLEATERIARTRLRCYAASPKLAEKFQNGTTQDGRQRPGDFLLATRDGVDVGTLTSLSLQMWMRGARLPCQGVAFVGTIKTHRRGGSDAQRGIASQLMEASLDKAREREQPLTALMPFRASFYEHFGYGNAEHRIEWTVPLAILPRGDFSGFRFYEPSDDAGYLELRSREARHGQCDIETDAAALANWQREWDGFGFVDQPTPGGRLETWARIVEDRGPQNATAVVDDWACSSPGAFARLLHFLASLKDQYTNARITLPRDVALNRMLRETQIPHRQVDHPVATARPYTRMQIRVLDHRRVLEAMQLPMSTKGRCTVAIRECEGTTTRLALDFSDGKCAVKPAMGDGDVELSDVMWASIVSGDLSATQAHRMGLIQASSYDAVLLLESFGVGPAPFCQEYF